MATPSSVIRSTLRDNREKRGNVGDFLKEEIQNESVLSFVSAYFTVHAYQALADKLENAHSLRFLFGEPSFISGIDRGDKQKANFKLTEAGITIANTLVQKPAAKACAAWIERMVEIRSMTHETMLLDAAIESIKRTFARRASASLFSGRDGLLPNASETPSSANDMELVTWLIVMGSSS